MLEENYPDPRIVVVGETGCGKSSISNALLGCDPLGDDCMFEVCTSLESCTSETTIGHGPWLGTGQNFTVVDTPGFGDSEGRDNEFIEEMMNVLNHELGYAQTILFVVEGSQPRFSESLYAMLRQMSSIFGASWWDYVMIGVSKWAYDIDSINDREEYCTNYPSRCQDEEWFMSEFNAQFADKFGLNISLTFAFIDSFSQTVGNVDDSLQQEYWINETQKLWDFSDKEENFVFMTIDDVLEENAMCKEENQRLNDIIDQDIAELKLSVKQHSEQLQQMGDDLSDVTGTAASNSEHIASNLEHIEENQALIYQHSEELATHADEITNNANNILRNSDDIDTLNDEVAKLPEVPVGTIMSWIMKIEKNGEDNLILPDGWVRCSNIQIEKGRWAGKYTPNLNGEHRFLRGGEDSEVLNLEDDMIQDHFHSIVDPGHSHTFKAAQAHTAWDRDDANDRQGTETSNHSTEEAKTGISINGATSESGDNPVRKGHETRPKNMRTVFIMRCW